MAGITAAGIASIIGLIISAAGTTASLASQSANKRKQVEYEKKQQREQEKAEKKAMQDRNKELRKAAIGRSINSQVTQMPTMLTAPKRMTPLELPDTDVGGIVSGIGSSISQGASGLKDMGIGAKILNPQPTTTTPAVTPPPALTSNYQSANKAYSEAMNRRLNPVNAYQDVYNPYKRNA